MTDVAMTDAAASSPVSGRRDLERLSLQRRKAEMRLLRERTRNARLAVVGVAGLALLLGVGLHSGWVPMSGHQAPLDEQSREFAATRIGHVLLPTDDDETCRELAFHNDTGKFSQCRTVPCADAISGTIDQVAADANGRALSVRGWFSKR